jgi:hypothetical protein
MATKIGILGSGIVGKTLADGFLKYDYEVKIGTRSPYKLDEWLNEAGEKASVGSFEETAAFGDLIVLAVKGHAAETVLSIAGDQNLEGKTVIDATNPIDESASPTNGVLHFFTEINHSLMETLQEGMPGANFVKAFNSVGSHFMVNPDFDGSTPTMFICGNDDSAKSEVSDIIKKFGWEVSDMGKVEAARAIEPLCMLWCIPGFLSNSWSHAFKLLKK